MLTSIHWLKPFPPKNLLSSPDMSHDPTPPRDPFLGNHYVRNPQHAEEGRSWGQRRKPSRIRIYRN
jgi:hypothetical protein